MFQYVCFVNAVTKDAFVFLKKLTILFKKEKKTNNIFGS